jgi:hypothetical protein
MKNGARCLVSVKRIGNIQEDQSLLDAMDFQRKDSRQWSRRGLERNICILKTIWTYDCLDDCTIVEGEVVEELIFVNFITVPELGTLMPSLTHLHESAWPNHVISWNRTVDNQKRLSVHYNTYTQYHPEFLTLKENMVEDSVETGIKSPEPEGMKRRRDSESHAVAMVITTPPPKWAGHYKE